MLTADHCDDHQADQTQPLLVASVTVGRCDVIGIPQPPKGRNLDR